MEVVKVLIKFKAKVNQAMEDGATPLIMASQLGKLEVVKVLIKSKAKVNQADEAGRTPLLAASQDGHAPVVQVLLDAGARSAELISGGIVSPLHVATANGHLACVKLLTGFRPNPPGWTAFLAGATSKKELAAYLSPPANRPPTYLPKIFDRAYLELIWKFQQERYSNLHLKGGPGATHTALMVAEACEQTDVAKLLRSMMVLKEGKVAGEKKKEPKLNGCTMNGCIHTAV